LVPADVARPVVLGALRLSASVLSEAIGGGLLEEALTAKDGRAGYTFYLDEQRVVKDLPLNDRAAVLSARLGQVDRRWLAGLRGDALVMGCDRRLDDTDVPGVVLVAAYQGGLLSGAEVVR
jgi:hypothetical protein